MLKSNGGGLQAVELCLIKEVPFNNDPRFATVLPSGLTKQGCPRLRESAPLPVRRNYEHQDWK